MAFNAKKLGIHVSSTGVGGILTYATGDDNKAAVGGAAFWNTDLSGATNAENLKARTAAEDFVRNQRGSATGAGGCHMLIIGSDGAAAAPYVATLDADGRIVPDAGA